MQLSNNPKISTIVLNWNRADLLKSTLDSYISTITVPFEIYIVDNASTDNSRDIIETFCSKLSNANAVLLNKNIGGEALNIAIEQCKGDYIHISENDIEYLSGWIERVLGLFEAFSDLGQISLFGPVPEDTEIWEIKESLLRYSKDMFLYEALTNVGTTSVLRRDIFDRGIRIENIRTTGQFLFPDDAKLSEAVKKMGYMVAWAPFYLVRNLGHLEKEIEHRIDYYRENYRSKYWFGVDELNKRLEDWKYRPKPIRKSFLFPEERISGEKSHPSQECPQPYLWSMVDGWTAEVETLEFLYVLIRLVKPSYVIETGTWRGLAAEAIARGLRDNGCGKLVTLEKDSGIYQMAKTRLHSKNLTGYVDILNMSSLDFIPEAQVDLVLFDSDLEIRIDEFWHFQPYLSPGALILFHDVSTSHKVVREGVQSLFSKKILQGFFPTPRGLAICQYSSDNHNRIKTEATRASVLNNLNKKTGGINANSPVYIAGMHRSGTSMVTHLLNSCGLYLGTEEELLKPNTDNPEGFWENIYFVKLNDRILEKLGGSWDLPPQEKRDWEQEKEFGPLKAEARVLINKYANHKLWGWKDPRNSLTLPFWKSICSDMKIIICLRNPIEVAMSLQKRGGTTDIFAYNLWYIYNKRLLSCTNPAERIVTHYNSYFINPENELKRILSFIGVEVDEVIIKRACSKISSILKHNNASMEDLINSSRVPNEVKELYLQMCEESGKVYKDFSCVKNNVSLKQFSMESEGNSIFGQCNAFVENNESFIDVSEDIAINILEKEIDNETKILIKKQQERIIALERTLIGEQELKQHLERMLCRFKETLPIIERLLFSLKTENTSDLTDVAVGELCFSIGMISNAREFFERALQKNPSNPEALNNLGVISFQFGDYKAAEDFLIQALSINSEHEEAKKNLIAVREKLIKHLS